MSTDPFVHLHVTSGYSMQYGASHPYALVDRAAANRLVSATHLAGERGTPVSGAGLVGAHAAGGDLLVLLGPASELGRALAARRPDLARHVLDAWLAVVDRDRLVVEVVSHRGR